MGARRLARFEPRRRAGRLDDDDRGLAWAWPTRRLRTDRHPLIETFGATLGGEQKFGDLDLSLHGSLDRTAIRMRPSATARSRICPATISTIGALRARAAYRQPEFTPFLDVMVDDAPLRRRRRLKTAMSAIPTASRRGSARRRLHPPFDRQPRPRLRRARLPGPAPAESREPAHRRLVDLVGDAADHGDPEDRTISRHDHPGRFRRGAACNDAGVATRCAAI